MQKFFSLNDTEIKIFHVEFYIREVILGTKANDELNRSTIHVHTPKFQFLG